MEALMATDAARVLFLVPAQLQGAHVAVGVGMRGKRSFVMGLLFSTRVMRGLLQTMSIFASFVRVLFLVPVQLWGVFVCVVWTDR